MLGTLILESSMGIGFMTLEPQSIGWLGFRLDATQRKRLDSFLGLMLNLQIGEDHAPRVPAKV